MEKQDLSKFISKKTSVVFGVGWAILKADEFETRIIIASVAVIYMVIDATKQIIQIMRKSNAKD